jgi:hypothetical protein
MPILDSPRLSGLGLVDLHQLAVDPSGTDVEVEAEIDFAPGGLRDDGREVGLQISGADAAQATSQLLARVPQWFESPPKI